MKDKIDEILFRIRHGVPSGHHYYRGSKHGGKVQFTYLPTSGDKKVLDGYCCYRINYDGGRYATAEGAFHQDLKENEWEYLLKGSSAVRNMKARFIGGKVSGTVDYKRRESTIGYTVNSHLQFDVVDGVVIGRIEGILTGGELKGFCDDEGRADGEWTFTEVEDDRARCVRHELWSHGTLQSSYEEDLVRKKRLEKSVKVSSLFDMILDGDISELLHIFRQGSENHIKFIRAESPKSE